LKVNFRDIPEGNHGILLKNLGSNKLYAGTLFRVFIVY